MNISFNCVEIVVADTGKSLAFACGDAAEVDRMHAEVVAAGYRSHRAPWDAFWGQRYAVLHDPDENGVDLFAPPASD
jgi:uncharacterized glyoxalase superfamily protein PhnB